MVAQALLCHSLRPANDSIPLSMEVPMNKTLRICVIFIATTCCDFAVAAIPPDGVSFSAHYESTVKGMHGEMETQTGKLWVAQGMIRSETLDEGHVMALINNPAKRETLNLVPDQGFYQDVSKRFYLDTSAPSNLPPGMIVITHDLIPGAPGDIFVDRSNPCAGISGATCASLGPDTVDGRQCINWRLTSKNGAWTECVDQKWGLLLKGERSGNTWAVSHIVEGKQHAKLFRVPADLQQTDAGEDIADKTMAPSND